MWHSCTQTFLHSRVNKIAVATNNQLGNNCKMLHNKHFAALRHDYDWDYAKHPAGGKPLHSTYCTTAIQSYTHVFPNN